MYPNDFYITVICKQQLEKFNLELLYVFNF